MRVLLLVLALLVASSAGAAKGKAGAQARAQAASGPSGNAGGGTVVHSSRGHMDPRNAPPMDPHRKVVEQDCSRPVDPPLGNLKCK